jgi:hypothetical protein
LKYQNTESGGISTRGDTCCLVLMKLKLGQTWQSQEESPRYQEQSCAICIYWNYLVSISFVRHPTSKTTENSFGAASGCSQQECVARRLRAIVNDSILRLPSLTAFASSQIPIEQPRDHGNIGAPNSILRTGNAHNQQRLTTTKSFAKSGVLVAHCRSVTQMKSPLDKA